MFTAKDEAVIIDTSQDLMEKGVYRYSFQVVREIRDHITQIPYGLVIINISEEALHHSYNRLNRDGRDIMIVNNSGIILSNKDKRLIGERLSKLVDFDHLLAESGYTIFKDGPEPSIIFYERIKGTQWYLMEDMDLVYIFSAP